MMKYSCYDINQMGVWSMLTYLLGSTVVIHFLVESDDPAEQIWEYLVLQTLPVTVDRAKTASRLLFPR